jgi:hypothetical protein
MAFRVLVIGGRQLISYSALRFTLDKLLAKRLPDVELLTAGGPGVPMLAASYATERGFDLRALLPEYGRFPEAAAVERRDAELVLLADAAVVVLMGNEPRVRRVLDALQARGVPVHVIGEGKPVKVKQITEAPRPSAPCVPVDAQAGE